jgi:hypothetical protein
VSRYSYSLDVTLAENFEIEIRSSVVGTRSGRHPDPSCSFRRALDICSRLRRVIVPLVYGDRSAQCALGASTRRPRDTAMGLDAAAAERTSSIPTRRAEVARPCRPQCAAAARGDVPEGGAHHRAASCRPAPPAVFIAGRGPPPCGAAYKFRSEARSCLSDFASVLAAHVGYDPPTIGEASRASSTIF